MRVLFLHLLLLLSRPFPLLGADDPNLQIVKTVLARSQRVENIGDVDVEHAEDLKALGTAALPILAQFLNKWPIGWHAVRTMLSLDADKSGPIIFAEVPDETFANAEDYAFRFFTDRILKGEVVSCAKEMHDAALRELRSNRHRQSTAGAIYAIGVTGTNNDWPFLEEFYENNDDTPRPQIGSIHNNTCAALARLGNSKYLDIIEQELIKPAPAEPTTLQAALLSYSIEQAAFTGNKCFVPLLCHHLSDPEVPERFYYTPGAMDIVFPYSSACAAAEALAEIIDHRLLRGGVSEEEFHKWKTWCENRKKAEQ